jgi:hypothetical protein
MRRVGGVLVLVLVMVVLSLCATTTALASTVRGTATFTDQWGNRNTTIIATGSSDSASGFVAVTRPQLHTREVYDVRALAVEDGWAYLILHDTTHGWMYMVAGAQEVSYIWVSDDVANPEADIRGLFDARWRMDEYLMPIVHGHYLLRA